ncbi:MAG TPA: bifunctional 5,10-methylene-tetrahydrofolate dehydrogenase/5,10-methylene-tetrahydrofolate cyclohydrolase [Candidatus Stercoripulliclostridium merdigallinarum]|uniref:Bifunctional protein FolD n=1 Tax=Candidatus Stercoripulliclostridium merdigallinarum TaxID=2840951 RepID=A0A9D1SHY3_9FIRM|nr:bifunctional 5,10-methylene-tetrahydrofolate dehydrogenase/5,10-methylene-tetrahydrofolate cyclohydrolase [Candidatus Stercoripulliclostridium merdigallinarum]
MADYPEKILDGRAVAKHIEAEVAAEIERKMAAGATRPILATIIVGENPSSVTYVRMKGNACRRVGIEPKKVELPEQTTTEELLSVIDELNADPDVYGILLQHPVPRQIDERACFDRIDPEKDVDGVGVNSLGKTALGLPGYRAATAQAIMNILNYYNIPLQGKEAVVIGRSPILGKPVAMLLLNANCTVTVTHTKTVDIDKVVRRADIVVAACGVPRFVKPEWVKPGAVVIDAGYNAGNIGDVDEGAFENASLMTPVPGGVGPVTIATLIQQTLFSFCKRNK